MDDQSRLRKPIYGENSAKLGDNSFQYGNDATSFLDISGLSKEESNDNPDNFQNRKERP